MVETLLKTLHLFAAIVWLGGMVFAHFFLRPSLPLLAPPERLKLMHAVLARFFAAVAVAAALVFVTGWALLWPAAARAPLGWWLMAAGGSAMVAIFGWIRFVPYPALARAVAAGDAPAGAAALARVRAAVSVNLWLGVAIVAALRLVPAG